MIFLILLLVYEMIYNLTLWPSGWAPDQATCAKMTLKLLHL